MSYINGVWYEDDSPLVEVDSDEDTSETPAIPEEPDIEIPVSKPITQSILLTIKKMLGISEEYHPFDIDIIVHINSTFLNLNQLGIGPDYPFSIDGDEQTWTDFLGSQKDILQGVQTYVYLKVRLLFDPPTNSFLVDSIQKQISELEWRLNTQAEYFIPPEPHAIEEPETPPPVTTEPEVPLRQARLSAKKSPIDIFSR